MAEVHNITDENFEEEVIKSPVPVVVDFWATWCVPCRAIEPIVEELSKTYDGKVKVVRINVDESQKTPARFGIRGIPTLLLFKEGRVKGQLVGAVPRAKIEELFQSALN